MGKGSLIVGNLVVDDRVEIGDCCEISKEHVEVGAVVLFLSFTFCAHAIVSRVES